MTIQEEQKVVVERRGPFLASLTFTAFGLAAWMPDSAGPGVFLLIAGISGSLAVWFAGGLKDDLHTKIFGGAAIVLLAMTSLRAAPWLAVINLLGSLGLAAYAVSGGNAWPEVVRGAFAPLARIPIAPAFLIRTVTDRENPRGLGVIRGIALGSLLALVFGSLFASADTVFGHFVERIFDFDLGLIPARAIIFVAAALLTTGFALSGKRFDRLKLRLLGHVSWGPLFSKREDGRRAWSLGRSEWVVALGMMNVLFVLFVFVQITVLFAGHDYVLRTQGLTYAEYAREGFFQLLFASMLTLGVVGVARVWADIRSEADGKLLEILLNGLCLFTLVILASAFKRLGLYEDAFGFTVARFFGHAVTIWLACVFLMVIGASVLRRFDLLPRTLIALTAVGLILMSLINPDGFIARANVERFTETDKVDTHYLGLLSSDALEAVAQLPRTERECALQSHRERLGDGEPWSTANLSRIKARKLLNGELRPDPSRERVVCPEPGYLYRD